LGNEKRALTGLTRFEESLLEIMQARTEKEKQEDEGYKFIEEEVFQEDFDEQEKEDLEPENQLLPEEEAQLQSEVQDMIEYAQNDGTTVLQYQPYKSKDGGNRAGSYSNEDIIRCIHEYNGVKKFMERALGLKRKSLNWYIHKRSPMIHEEYLKVIGNCKTKFQKRPPDKVIGAALFKAKGIMSDAADILGVSLSSLKRWINDSITLRQFMDEVEYRKDDFYESKLDELAGGVLVKGFDNLGRPTVYEKPPELGALKLRLKKTRKEKFGDSVEVNKNIRVEPIKFIYVAPAPPMPQSLIKEIES